uniref:D-alanine--D-alanine ligase family protein n=1 Tax=Numidum massiliense TaxID=1522315 RepID=UPI0006D54069|nr:D-alanine--D-alanine ligase family protein [Numidum massiliense]
MAQKKRIAVLFGGRSGEHEVSLLSARSVIESLNPDMFDIIPIAITREGEWKSNREAVALLGEGFDAEKLSLQTADVASVSDSDAADGGTTTASPANKATTASPANKATTADAAATTAGGGGVPLTGSAQGLAFMAGQKPDVVFPVLHGTYGEDGTVQGMLEMADIPYVGAGVLASAVGMDKVMMKRLFAEAGLPQGDFTAVIRRNWERDPNGVIAAIERQFTYPVFVKPANLGSSVGISKAKDRESLTAAINLACRYDRKIVVEQFIPAREVEVAVLGNDNPEASVPGEIMSSNEFYDYRAKYIDGKSVLQIPADLPAETVERIREYAITAFQSIDCSGLARVDFFVRRDTGEVLLNEINTMPGFTPFSMYAKLWEHSGLIYRELVERLIALAFERYAEQEKNETTFAIQ